ncbi:MAG: UDP-N-acetylmuramate dehydrogenase, partial [Candidatus Rokuibacteriota bacterium]
LRPRGAPTIRYPEVERHLAARGIAAPTLADARASVLAIRRAKSMVLDPDDINRRSCGSFFVNPVVSAEHADRLTALGLEPPMPRWPQPDGRVKLSAAWLIERASFLRGYRKGSIGLSTRHALAIVAHDGARTRDILGFARRLQDAVRARFGVALVPEPVFWS